MKLYPIFKRENAMKLKQLGFPIEDCETNKKNPNYVIYYFEETEEFKKAFSKIQK